MSVDEIVRLLNIDLASTDDRMVVERLDDDEAADLLDCAVGEYVCFGFTIDQRYDGGVMALPSSSEATQLGLAVVNRAQDFVIDSTWKAWPECELHGHPLDIKPANDGTLEWWCPRLRRPVAQLGSALREST